MNTTPLDTTLRTTGRWVMLAEGVRAAALALAVIIVAVLLAVAVDAVVALRPTGLLVVDGLLLALMAGALGYVLLRLLRQSFDRRRVARLIEDRLELKQSDLINAVEFEGDPQGGARGTSTELREAAVARGVQLASSLAPARLIDKRPAKAACGLALAALAITGALYLLLPGVFQSVIPRLLDPYGDRPPFTLVHFTFDHPAEVFEGKPADIRVTLTGHNLPDRADIVFVDSAGATEQTVASLPMLREERHEGTEARRHEGKDGEAAPLAFVLPIAKADRTRMFYVNTPHGRSEKRTLTVVPVPRFEQVTVTYDPPAYTGWKRTTESLSAKGIRALHGTKATITVKSNMSLASGELQLTNSQPGTPASSSAKHALTTGPESEKTAGVTLDLTTSATFSISLTAANASQTKSLEPLSGKITVFKDAPPKIIITEPGERTIIAPEGWKVPVHFEIEDDVRVERLTLFSAINKGSPVAEPLAIGEKGPRVLVKYEFDLGAWAAKAGDTISFFATAHDNFPTLPGGGQSSDSEIYTIHVISMEDYLTQARSEYQMEEVLAEIDRFDKLLKELDAKREALLKEVEALQKKIAEQGGEPTAEDQKKLDELNQKLAEYAEAQWNLAKEMRERSEQPNLYDFERAYANMLAEQASELDRGAEDATKLKREHEFNRKENPGDKGEAQRHLKEMAKQLKRDEQRMDDAQQQASSAESDMKMFEQADAIMAEAQRLAAIIEAQRGLADRLATFKDKEKLSPAEELRAHRLAQEQQALKEELADTMKRLEEAAKQAEAALPKMAASARQMCESLKSLDVPKDQTDAERMAMAGQGQGAHKAAESAATKLESLLGECEGMQGEGQQELADAAFKLQKQSAGQSLKQLSQGRGLPQLKQSPGQQGSSQGSRGMRGKASVYGPRSAGRDNSNKRGGRDGTGQGAGKQSDVASTEGPETLSPDTAASRGQGAAAIPGVPTRYRDLADQYFRRLAEESK